MASQKRSEKRSVFLIREHLSEFLAKPEPAAAVLKAARSFIQFWGLVSSLDQRPRLAWGSPTPGAGRSWSTLRRNRNRAAGRPGFVVSR